MSAAAPATRPTLTAIDPGLTSDVAAAVFDGSKASISNLQRLYVRAAATNDVAAMITVAAHNFPDVDSWAARGALWEALYRNHPDVVHYVASSLGQALNDPASAIGKDLAMRVCLDAIGIEAERKGYVYAQPRSQAMETLVMLPAFRDMTAGRARDIMTTAAQKYGLPNLFAGVFVNLLQLQ